MLLRPQRTDLKHKMIAASHSRGRIRSEEGLALETSALESPYGDQFIFSYASINVNPEGGGGTPGICGAFDLYCLPHPREFD